MIYIGYMAALEIDFRARLQPVGQSIIVVINHNIIIKPCIAETSATDKLAHLIVIIGFVNGADFDSAALFFLAIKPERSNGEKRKGITHLKPSGEGRCMIREVEGRN